MNRLVSMSVFAASALFPISPGAQPNLLANPSFELPTVPANGFLLFPPASLTGWSVFGPPGTDVGVVNTGFTQNAVAFTAQDRTQWLDLTGLGSNSSEGVSQTVATTTGHLYSLSYYIGNTTGGGIFGTESTVNLLLDGTNVQSDMNADVSPTTLDWKQFTHTFVASSTSTTVGFQNADPVTDNSNGLDNVVLLDLGPAVLPALPEPEALALLSLVFVGLGISSSRRPK